MITLEGVNFQQTYRACYDCLSNVGNLIHQAGHSAGLDERSIYQVETAVDEACSNIIEHAYGGEDKGDITIACSSKPGELTVKITDNGIPFDPEFVGAPKIDLSLDDRPERGLGLFFIRRWMDSVRFNFSQTDGNSLTMVKKVKEAP